MLKHKEVQSTGSMVEKEEEKHDEIRPCLVKRKSGVFSKYFQFFVGFTTKKGFDCAFILNIHF